VLRSEELRWTAEEFSRVEMGAFVEDDIEFSNLSGVKEFVYYLENMFYSLVKVEEQQDFKYRKTKVHGNYSTLIENIKDDVQLLWVDMLMQVPGVNEYMAVAVSKRYMTLGLLYKAWRELDNKYSTDDKELKAKEDLLSNLEYSNPN